MSGKPDRRRRSFRTWLARRIVSPLQGVTFGRWHALLTRDGPAIHREFLVRAVLTGVGSLLNSAQAQVERRRYDDRLQRIRVRAPVFILGHYRSGTTHLHNLLAIDRRLAFPSYYQVSFPNTFLVGGRLGSRLGAGLMPERRPHDNVKLGLREPAEDELALCSDTFLSPHMCWHFPCREAEYRRYLSLREATDAERRLWKRSLRQLARKLTYTHGRTLVFKSPCHTARVALILETFPDARFVHIHRDPLRVFQSTRYMEAQVTPLFQFQRRDLSRLDEFILWRFREMYDRFLLDRGTIPRGRLAELSYEQLVRDPVGSLRRVYEQLGLPEFEGARVEVEQYLAQIRGYRTNEYGELEPGLRDRIRREWRNFFEAWGYAPFRRVS